MEKQSQHSAEKADTKVRQKEGQGLEFWASTLLEQGAITRQVYDEFIKKNNSKEKLMEERGFPQLRHYGLFGSLEEIKDRLSGHENERFIIRCKSRENGEIKRMVDTDFSGVLDFATSLPGGFDKWVVEIKEFVNTIVSGTIIVDPSGKTTVETWKGPHYLNITNVPKYHAEFDPDKFHQSYQWKAPEGAQDTAEFQEYAISAIRYIFPHLKPGPGEPIYVEYGVKPSGEVYFIEASDAKLLTGK